MLHLTRARDGLWRPIGTGLWRCLGEILVLPRGEAWVEAEDHAPWGIVATAYQALAAEEAATDDETPRTA